MSVTSHKKLRFLNKVDTTGKYVVSLAKSNRNVIVQISDSVTKQVLFSKSSSNIKTGTKSEKAETLSQEIANYINSNKLSPLVFNRNGNVYHGRVKAFVEGLRKNNVVI